MLNLTLKIKDVLYKIDATIEHSPIFIGLTLTLFASLSLLFLYLIPMGLNSDVSWYLYASGEVLNGKILYRDIIDCNMPFIFYFCLPPILISRLLCINDIVCFYGYVFFLITISLFLCRNLLGKLLDQHSRTSFLFIFSTLAFFFLLFPGAEFAQREHLMFVFVMPYILAIPARLVNIQIRNRQAIAIGILAGIGFSFKPHFFLVWIFMECFAVFKSGVKSIKRTENISAILIFISYGTYIAIYEHDFIKRIPFIIASYSDLGLSLTDMIYNKFTGLWVICICFSLLLKYDLKKEFYIERSLFIASSSFFFSCFFQKQFWPYHLYPFLSSIGILASIVFVRFLAFVNFKSLVENRIKEL